MLNLPKNDCMYCCCVPILITTSPPPPSTSSEPIYGHTTRASCLDFQDLWRIFSKIYYEPINGLFQTCTGIFWDKLKSCLGFGNIDPIFKVSEGQKILICPLKYICNHLIVFTKPLWVYYCDIFKGTTELKFSMKLWSLWKYDSFSLCIKLILP